MKRKLSVFVTVVAVVLSVFSVSFCASDAAAVLKGVDEVINAPKDQDMTLKIVLKEKSGKESIRELSMLQKGENKRIAKFLSPADQKGIAFLSLPGDTMYVYLPAFKKTRRIATSVKNGKFAGTDFTYEDMEPIRYTGKWEPSMVSEDKTSWVISIKPNKGTQSDYSELKLTVLKENYFPVKIEHHDKSGKPCKILLRDNVTKDGGYWMSHSMKMEDLKSGHSTDMITQKIIFDSGLADDKFTERSLSR